MEETGNSVKKVPLRETNVIQEYLDGMAIKNLAEKYGCTVQNVRGFLNRHGVETKRKTQTSSPYTLNEKWLDEMDCQEKWYFLGFFHADGTNSVNKNQIRVKLNIQDINMLELFKKWFGSNRPLLPLDKNGEIRTYQGCKEIVLTSKHLCDRMTELGAPENKTEILQFPDWIPDDMMNHFLRGYFDGDGNITLFKTRSENEQIRANITIVSSHDFINNLNKYFLNNLGFESNVYHEKKYANLKIEKAKDIKIFLDWLYQDASCFMPRKHDKAVSFLNGRDFTIETSYEKRDRIIADKEKIVQRYLNGETATKIALDYNCLMSTITRYLKKWGIEIRKTMPPKRTKKKIK